jgi:hypothetical protein
MLSTINFDNKHLLEANKVDDVGTDRNLTLELYTAEAMSPKVVP